MQRYSWLFAPPRAGSMKGIMLVIKSIVSSPELPENAHEIAKQPRRKSVSEHRMRLEVDRTRFS